nr:Z protein [Ngerengere mammarenavirus]
MGQVKSAQTHPSKGHSVPRSELIPDATHMGPAYCRSCWQKVDGLIACHEHYLCRDCLNLLLTVSDRCPLCKHPLPTNLKVVTQPSAPPPPYTP